MPQLSDVRFGGTDCTDTTESNTTSSQGSAFDAAHPNDFKSILLFLKIIIVCPFTYRLH